jgi:hypothetical protein
MPTASAPTAAEMLKRLVMVVSVMVIEFSHRNLPLISD